MSEHDIKREIREKLKLEAKEIARRIGYANYNVDGAEEDFRSYLKEYRGGKMAALYMLSDFKDHIEYTTTVLKALSIPQLRVLKIPHIVSIGIINFIT